MSDITHSDWELVRLRALEAWAGKTSKPRTVHEVLDDASLRCDISRAVLTATHEKLLAIHDALKAAGLL